MSRHQHRRAVRALCAITIGALGLGLAAGAAAAQAGTTQGVTAKTVKLGFIWSGTGVAAPNFEDSGKACQARVDAQNAKGGVNGRKIDLQEIARQLDRLEIEFARFMHKVSHGFFERRH